MEKITNSTNEDEILPERRVLLIDNGSDSLCEYLTLLIKYKVEIISFKNIKTCDFRNYSLIILSDGHSINVSKNTDVITMVLSSDIPTIGICYGFQLLCYAYGAKLIELPQKREGLLEITAEIRHSIFQNQNNYIVSEKHRFGVKSIPETLACLARSIDGCEIIQVRGKQQFGLQFHPENKNSQNEGVEIFNNLLKFIFSE